MLLVADRRDKAPLRRYATRCFRYAATLLRVDMIIAMLRHTPLLRHQHAMRHYADAATPLRLHAEERGCYVDDARHDSWRLRYARHARLRRVGYREEAAIDSAIRALEHSVCCIHGDSASGICALPAMRTLPASYDDTRRHVNTPVCCCYYHVGARYAAVRDAIRYYVAIC